MKVKLYCRCGASLVGQAPRSLAEGMTAQWKEDHNGPGHAECDARAAARARRVADKVGYPKEEP